VLDIWSFVLYHLLDEPKIDVAIEAEQSCCSGGGSGLSCAKLVRLAYPLRIS
jgi:hypothetical protein